MHPHMYLVMYNWDLSAIYSMDPKMACRLFLMNPDANKIYFIIKDRFKCRKLMRKYNPSGGHLKKKKEHSIARI